MMHNFSIKKRLLIIKILSFILDLIAVAFISWERYYFIGVIIVIISLLMLVVLYRCPHCGCSLDIRLNISDHTHCPECGEIIVEDIINVEK
jgi:DNA-directed RNA polymerase subunit RPC12/RpoP